MSLDVATLGPRSTREAVLGGFDATPAELHATSVLLSQVGDEARADLASLGLAARDLLEGEWRGAAATAFARGWSQWQHGAGEVLDGLAAMARLLEVTGQGYEAAEADSASRARGWS